MSPVDAVKTCFSKYVTFSGRARRPEYWWFWLACLLAGALASALDMALFGATLVTETATTGPDQSVESVSFSAYGEGPIATVIGLAALMPLLAAGWRRVHDMGKPGWHGVMHWVLAPLWVAIAWALDGVAGLPLVIGILAAGIYSFLCLVSPTQPGPNRFGPEPAS